MNRFAPSFARQTLHCHDPTYASESDGSRESHSDARQPHQPWPSLSSQIMNTFSAIRIPNTPITTICPMILNNFILCLKVRRSNYKSSSQCDNLISLHTRNILHLSIPHNGLRCCSLVGDEMEHSPLPPFCNNWSFGGVKVCTRGQNLIFHCKLSHFVQDT